MLLLGGVGEIVLGGGGDSEDLQCPALLLQRWSVKV